MTRKKHHKKKPDNSANSIATWNSTLVKIAVYSSAIYGFFLARKGLNLTDLKEKPLSAIFIRSIYASVYYFGGAIVAGSVPVGVLPIIPVALIGSAYYYTSKESR